MYFLFGYVETYSGVLINALTPDRVWTLPRKCQQQTWWKTHRMSRRWLHGLLNRGWPVWSRPLRLAASTWKTQTCTAECGSFSAHVWLTLNITCDSLRFPADMHLKPPACTSSNHLTQPVKTVAAADVRSTSSAPMKRRAKITALITRLDDEQQAVRLAWGPQTE